jgi:arylformamidase
MKVIDLSQSFRNDMPQFPGTPPIEIEQIAQIKDGGFRITDFHSIVHTGTHCDAPAHCVEGGKMMEELDLDVFVGNAIMIDAPVEESREIPVDILDGIDILPGDIVIIRTGYSKYWGQAKYVEDSPYISEELAKALSELDIKSVGIDFLSPDKVDSTTSPIHNILMGKGIPFIENLANLDKIDRERFFFSAAPILIDKADGGFTRAFAVLED